MLTIVALTSCGHYQQEPDLHIRSFCGEVHVAGNHVAGMSSYSGPRHMHRDGPTLTRASYRF